MWYTVIFQNVKFFPFHISHDIFSLNRQCSYIAEGFISEPEKVNIGEVLNLKREFCESRPKSIQKD